MITCTRCLALEQAYVHDVYAQIARECGACSPVRSNIKEFLFQEFDTGSLLIDIGCGDGKYLNLNPNVFTVGLERCNDWFGKEANTYMNSSVNNHLIHADIVSLPVRDEFFDGVLCCGVLHHISTNERRIKSLKEMSRVLKIGGKLLVTVWAFEGREVKLGSQDVLIKWNSSKKKKSNKTDSSASSESDDDTSSCSTTTANYVNRRAAYESCNSPTADFGTCYSFVRRALIKFNLAPSNFYNAPSRRASKSSTSKDASGTDSLPDDMPIELRNIDNPSDPFIKNNHINNFSIYNSNSRERYHHQNQRESFFNNCDEERPRLGSKDNINYGSLLSIIKEHILPKQSKNKPKQKLTRFNGFLSHHRFSLPVVSLSRNSSQNSQKSSTKKSSFNDEINSNLSIDKRIGTPKLFMEDVKAPALERNISKKSDSNMSLNEKDDQLGEVKTLTSGKRREVWGKILQKSLSSDSLESKVSKQSRQQSTGTETTSSDQSSKLLAYYSMPELRTLTVNPSANDKNKMLSRPVRNRPTLTDLHPITFLVNCCKDMVMRDDSQDTQAATDEIVDQTAIDPQIINYHELRFKRENLQLNLPLSRLPEKTDILVDEIENKKTQRSLSVEYKPKISPSSKQQRRRFSASPSLHVPKTFIQLIQQDQLGHETHPSVDSEESFVTIIPANRTGSIDIGNDAESDSFLDEVMMDQFDEQSQESADDALCENLSNHIESDGENTSASTEVTTKSVTSLSSKTPTASRASTPSPPANLHRYFHLFRCGELEELIERNVQNLHVVNSYYSEHATSWCIVAEKVQVWTI